MNPDNLRDLIDQLLQAAGDGRSPPRLPPQKGDGTPRDMEPRIAKLEAHVENIRAELAKLSSLPVTVGKLEERVSHLPSKGFVVTATTTTIGLLTAITIFGDKVKTILGV
jgi:hypothetical protein